MAWPPRNPRLLRLVFRLLSLYPPYLGAGIRLLEAAPERRRFRVCLKARWYNRNYFGTHFGGSLYAMCDPFFVLILAYALGRDYWVWDKAATVRFLKPGRGTVCAEFSIAEERVSEIRAAADRDGRCEPRFEVEVRDAAGDVVAHVEKLLWVGRKDRQNRG